jgi:hypothetical protein
MGHICHMKSSLYKQQTQPSLFIFNLLDNKTKLKFPRVLKGEWIIMKAHLEMVDGR